MKIITRSHEQERIEDQEHELEQQPHNQTNHIKHLLYIGDNSILKS